MSSSPSAAAIAALTNDERAKLHTAALTRMDGETLDALTEYDAQRLELAEGAENLMDYAPDKDAYAEALAVVQPTRLHIVTLGPPTDTPPCTGGYTCGCPDCLNARVKPIRRAQAPQPWTPRPSRHAA